MARTEFGLGIGYVLAAYLIWGIFPLYFSALAPAGPMEVVALRVLLSLAFCIVVIALSRKWRPLGMLFRSPKRVVALGVAGALVYVNWLVYVYATSTGQVVEAALGYFINPIVTVSLGVLFLRNRLRRLQWVAVALAGVAVVVLAVGYGKVPFISLALAFSFAFYGLVKNSIGAVDALSGLTLETAWLAPLAAIQMLWLGAGPGISWGAYGAGHAILLGLAGVITAIPLLMFAAAARRIPLVYVGLVQFSSPILQFLVGVLVFHEAMPAERWMGFGIVWLAALVVVADSLGQLRTTRAARRQAATK